MTRPKDPKDEEPELDDLYQEILLDHNRNPRNFGDLPEANRTARGYNPLCGDQVEVFLDIEGDRIEKIRFKGSGCAISQASASMMTALLKGKTVAEAKDIFGKFHKMLTGPAGTGPDPADMGELEAFAGVREFPMRVKCATLVWHTLQEALAGKKQA